LPLLPARMTSMKLLHLDSGVLESHWVRLPHWIVPVGPSWQGRVIQTGTPSARSEQQDAGDRPADLLRTSLSGPQMSHFSLFAIDCSPLGSAEPPHQALRRTRHECSRGKLFKEDGPLGGVSCSYRDRHWACRFSRCRGGLARRSGNISALSVRSRR
jgi:hypothetical protein